MTVDIDLPGDTQARKEVMEYRIQKLYRQATGLCWWVQWGYWAEQGGPTSVLYGRGRRIFRVQSETPHRTEQAAIRDLRQRQGCDCSNPPPADWDGVNGVYHVSESCPIHNFQPTDYSD